MTLDEYQRLSKETAIYPDKGSTAGLAYCVLGLNGEAGEVAEKVKKVIRDYGGVLYSPQRAELLKELGDVLWYLSQIATELGAPLSCVAMDNLSKLAQRKEKQTLNGSGDNR